ncbi:unnamed protein product [Effrenium voratum]|nr:unnamed protein product [Effrenium voratum]
MSGLAGKVRRATESDEFDLSGYDQARCNELAKAAFSEPFPLKEMVRISFVVGGGKLVRQKYAEELPKYMVNALSTIGFTEDNSATVEASSAGKFKYHHDTNKNLKLVHVFPKLSGEVGASAAAEEEEAAPKVQTPEDVLLRSEEKEFQRLLQTHLASYAQKKRLLELLKHRVAVLEDIEARMARLERLSAEEEALFEDVGAEDLKEKIKVVTAEMKEMVEQGQLTAAEKAEFLEQLESKVTMAKEELAKAEAEGKAKKAQALKQQLEVMQQTRATVKDADAAPLPALKNGAKIRELRVKLIELDRIEKASKGHYTMEELKKLGERPELEEAAAELETRARGWLEADEVFEERLQANLRLAVKAKAKSKSSGGYTAVSGGARPAAAKASGAKTRNNFAALG